MEIEVDDREYDLAIQEQRHEELKSIFTSILYSVKKEEPIKPLIQELGKRLDIISKNLTLIKPIDDTAYSKKIVDLLQLNLVEIQSLRKEISNKEIKEWEFTVERGFDGTIKKVKAKQL